MRSSQDSSDSCALSPIRTFPPSARGASAMSPPTYLMPFVSILMPSLKGPYLQSEDSERSPTVIADNIDELFREFDEVASRSQATTVDWLQGARIPPSAVACHLLEECLVHGHDIATATNQPWVIERHHALLAIECFALPLIQALPPTALLNPDRAQSLCAQIDMRLRGGVRTHMALNNGSLTFDSDAVSNVDVHVSADPAAFLLMFMGRQGMWKPLVTGKAMAWGRRPWQLVRALGVLAPP